MKKLLFVFGVIFIFLMQTVFSYGIVSDDYSVDSYHIGLAGENSSNANYDLRFTLTYQQSGESDIENLNYEADVGWLSLPSYCGDGICDDDEDCSSCPSDCGICPTPPDGNGGDGGCTYDWVCSDWYPSPCSANEIQERVCINRGTCTGTLGMPDITRNCTYIPIEPLFDIFAKIPLIKKWIIPGEPAEIDVKIISLGEITQLDVLFKYTIVSEDNVLITELQETRAITKGEEFKIIMNLPPDIELGKYKFYVQINYDTDKVALAQDSFEIVESKLGKFIWIILMGLIIFLIIGIIVFLIYKIKKSQTKNTEILNILENWNP